MTKICLSELGQRIAGGLVKAGVRMSGLNDTMIVGG
jgi:hypothetical protein